MTTSNQETAQDSVSFSPGFGVITAAGFARNYGGAQHAFGLVVSGVEFLDIQEAQQMGAVGSDDCFWENGIKAKKS